jgi:hypothetical protein
MFNAPFVIGEPGLSRQLRPKLCAVAQSLMQDSRLTTAKIDNGRDEFEKLISD